MTTLSLTPEIIDVSRRTEDLAWLGDTSRADAAHALRMSMPALAGRAWTPEAIHYLAEREHFIDLSVFGREISFTGRLDLLRGLHQVEGVSRA